MSIKVTITDEQRTSLLTDAIEGGSNYWYLFEKKADSLIRAVKELETNDECFPGTFVWKLWSALKEGMSIPIHDLENGEFLGSLSLDKIEKGERLMYKNSIDHFASILQENTDAITADIWFQYAVMGKIIYG